MFIFYAEGNDSKRRGGIKAAERRKRGYANQGLKSLGRWERVIPQETGTGIWQDERYLAFHV